MEGVEEEAGALQVTVGQAARPVNQATGVEVVVWAIVAVDTHTQIVLI